MMIARHTLLALGMLAVLAPSAALVAHPPEQDAAYHAKRQGDIKPFPEIRSRITPRMGGASYLGSEFDPGAAIYRLKYMRGTTVIWVDVDARTGAIVGRSGN